MFAFEQTFLKLLSNENIIATIDMSHSANM